MNQLRGQFRGARPSSHPVFPQQPLQAPTLDCEMEEIESEMEEMEWQSSYF